MGVHPSSLLPDLAQEPNACEARARLSRARHPGSWRTARAHLTLECLRMRKKPVRACQSHGAIDTHSPTSPSFLKPERARTEHSPTARGTRGAIASPDHSSGLRLVVGVAAAWRGGASRSEAASRAPSPRATAQHSWTPSLPASRQAAHMLSHRPTFIFSTPSSPPLPPPPLLLPLWRRCVEVLQRHLHEVTCMGTAIPALWPIARAIRAYGVYSGGHRSPAL